MTTLIQLTQSLLFHNASLLAQVEYSTEGKPPSPLSMIVGLLIALLLIVAMWKVFTKAGQPGWASIIPIYNLYIWCKIVGRPGWWILLMLIPCVNIIVGISITRIHQPGRPTILDRKSTRLNSTHEWFSYAILCLKKQSR